MAFYSTLLLLFCGIGPSLCFQINGRFDLKNRQLSPEQLSEMNFSSGYLYQPYFTDMSCANGSPYYVSGTHVGTCLTAHVDGVNAYYAFAIDLNGCLTVQNTQYKDADCTIPVYTSYYDAVDLGFVWVPDASYISPSCFEGVSYGTYVACSATQSGQNVPPTNYLITQYSDNYCTEVYSYLQLASGICNDFGEFGVFVTDSASAEYYSPNTNCTGTPYKTEIYSASCTIASTAFGGKLQLWQKTVNV